MAITSPWLKKRKVTWLSCAAPLNRNACLNEYDGSALPGGLDLPVKSARLVFSTQLRAGKAGDPNHLELAPFEVYIAEIS